MHVIVYPPRMVNTEKEKKQGKLSLYYYLIIFNKDHLLHSFCCRGFEKNFFYEFYSWKQKINKIRKIVSKFYF